MRVLEKFETEIQCDNCLAKLAITSSDIKIYVGERYVKCPICGNAILVNNMLS